MGRHDEDDLDVAKEKKEKSKHRHSEKDRHKDKSHKHKELDKPSDDAAILNANPEQQKEATNGLPLPPRSEDATTKETGVQDTNGKKEDIKGKDERSRHGREGDDNSSREKRDKHPRDVERDRRRDRNRDRERGRDRNSDRHMERDDGSRKDRDSRKERDEKDRDKRKDDKESDRKEKKDATHRSERRDKEDRGRAPEAEEDGRASAAVQPAVATDPEGDYMEEDLPGPPPAPPAAASSAPEEPFVQDIKPQVQESGGEISMSIEETNRVRISLGLKPLSMENEKDKRQKEAAAREAKRAEEEKEAKAAELAERIRAQREKRLEEEKLRKVTTLGEAADDVDDLAAWVTKSRALEEKAKAEARAKALKQARALEEMDDEYNESDEEDEAGAPMRSAKELAGMKVKHNAEELNEGETMILTLADRTILDEKGELDDDADELENALVIEQRKRDKARRAASSRHKPLFGEDGVERGLLDKYDEEADAMGMEIDESGAVSNEKAKQQAEIRAKLAAAAQSAGVNTEKASYDARSEYFTKEEMADLFRPKKKKAKKKLRKKDAMEDLSFLEAEAEAAAAAGVADHGSRGSRSGPADAAEAERARDAAMKEQRYKAALEKANYASLALKEEQEQEGTLGEDEEELQAVLARARRAAAAKAEADAAAEEGPSVARIAEEAARRRAAEEAQRAADAAEGEDMAFTEAAEFARGIHVEEAAAKERAESSSHMGIDDDVDLSEKAPGKAAKAEPAADAKWGAWVAAGADADEATDEDMADADEDDGNGATEELLAESVTRERNVGKGLGAALALLQERGELTDTIQWAGRNTDVMAAQHLARDGQLKDVYSGGRHASSMDDRIERALTQRDEFGNVMTPKERFRYLCYGFHGITPSKNKQDKRFKKVAEDLERKKRLMGTGGGEEGTIARLHAVQEQTATPYLVLSGKVKPGQSSDPASGFATVERDPIALTPVLGGGETPLTGNRKVEAMLGVKRPRNGAGSMAPPPPRKPKAA